MISKPTQAFGRFEYQTGQVALRPGVTGQRIIPAANAFEQSSLVNQTPCFVSLIECVSDVLSVNDLYLLAFDLPATDAVTQAVIAGTMGAARSSYGPISPGGSMAREFSEVFPGAHAPFFVGLPFDLGVLVVASSTPRVFTAPGALDQYALLVRGTMEVCR